MVSAFPKFDIPGVWRGERKVAAVPVSTTGDRQLDQALLGGWPLGSLIQISGSDEGLGFSLIIDSLAQITRADRYVALVHTPLLPCAPALGSRGINLERLLWVQPDNQAGALWAMEQMTRSGLFAAVAYWGSPLDSTSERRLQLAADAGQCLAFCFRTSRRDDHTYAAVRLCVSSHPDADVTIEVQKCRGRNAGQRLRRPYAEVAELLEA